MTGRELISKQYNPTHLSPGGMPPEALQRAKETPRNRNLELNKHTISDDTAQGKHRQSHIKIDTWLNDRGAQSSDPEKGLPGDKFQETEQKEITVIDSIVPLSPLSSIAQSEALDESMSPGGSQTDVSSRQDPSSPEYWITLPNNGIILDQTGAHIPEEVQEIIDMHIRKKRDSPRLNEQDHIKINDHVMDIWHMTATNEFSGFTPYPYPKPDKHIGFSPSLRSKWSFEQLSVANHPVVKPYTQPSHENMFPRMIFQFKSEATKGNLHTAEAQVAGAGAHCVSAFHQFLDIIGPERKKASTDALAFSSVVSQREAVVYVHFYDPVKEIFYMSFVDAFYFVKKADAQRCHGHHKNVAECMLEFVQPELKDLLTKAHPPSKTWKKGRPASTMLEVDGPVVNGDGHQSKRQRTESNGYTIVGPDPNSA